MVSFTASLRHGKVVQ
jgi:uncharacterized protein YeaO (DUF488 family)